MRRAGKLAADIRREHQRAEITRVKAEAQADAKKQLVAAGVMDSPAIKASGAGKGSDKELERAVAAGTIVLTPAMAARLNKYWNS